MAAHHQAVQQELIMGEADEWQGLLVGLLPSLKQVQPYPSSQTIPLAATDAKILQAPAAL